MTAVEFALVAPFLIMTVLGMIEVGRIIWVQNTLETAVQVGARYAAIHPDAAAEQVIAQARQGLALDMADATFMIGSTVDANGVDFVMVSVSQQVGIVVPFTEWITGSSITLNARAAFPIVQ